MPTVLVGFTDSADVVYEGRAGDRATFERTLRTVAPTGDSGGADVASALERARLHLAGLPEQPPFARLLLVTDDLTAPGDLLQAAYDCAHSGITVDVVVLDTSPRAGELAEVIVGVTGGSWEAAPGEGDLGRAISAAGRRAALQSLEAGTRPVEVEPVPAEPVPAEPEPERAPAESPSAAAVAVAADGALGADGVDSAGLHSGEPADAPAGEAVRAEAEESAGAQPGAGGAAGRGPDVPEEATAAPGGENAGGEGAGGEGTGGEGTGGEEPPGRRRPAPRRVDVTFPVFTLVPTVANGNVERIGESLRTIVPFLEDLTGLRYYPPPTYVTDDTTVTHLRRTCEPDARFTTEDHTGDIPPGVLAADEEAAVDRVRALLVTFTEHVLDVGPDTDLVHVRREALGGFAGNVRRYLAGRPTSLDEDSGAGPSFPEPPMIWRQRCAEDFPSFAGLYCELVTRYTDRHIRAHSRNRIDPEVRVRLVAELGPRAAAAIERSVGGVVADPPIDQDFRVRLGAALDDLRAMVDARDPVTSDFLRSGANVFGVFRYSGGAGRFGRSGMLVPTSAPAVLMGAGALGKVAAALRGDAVLDESTWERAAVFCELALVHEHTHAAIATGLDEHGARAAAAGTSAWAAGTRLNEALAAWAQAHFYRDNPRMAQECTHYIRSGSHRTWPYRGADILERLYQDGGIEPVRRFIRLLRVTPETAQAEFDLLPAR
ncbi:vWA domain-containing protein [Parafrankia colletiae]|nr:VWA domain-containing protein [Parafrankia colletiae]